MLHFVELFAGSGKRKPFKCKCTVPSVLSGWSAVIFLNRRSYHRQCLRIWGIERKVCGCLHLSFTSLNDVECIQNKNKKNSGTVSLKKCLFITNKKSNLCAQYAGFLFYIFPGELMSQQPPTLRYQCIPGWTYFGGLDSWCVYSWPWPQLLWTCLTPASNETTSIK